MTESERTLLLTIGRILRATTLMHRDNHQALQAALAPFDAEPTNWHSILKRESLDAPAPQWDKET